MRGPALFMVVIVLAESMNYGSGKYDGKHGEAEFGRQACGWNAPSTHILS